MRPAKRRLIGLAVIQLGLRYFSNILEGVERYAEGKSAWNFVPVLVERRTLHVQGLDALLDAVSTREEAALLRRWGRPVVNVGLMVPDLPFPHVGVDNALVGRLAFNHFFERGLRNFAFVGPTYGLYSTLREQTFREAVTRAGFELHTYWIRFRSAREFDPPGWPAEPRMEAWLRKLPKPVGLFVPWDLLGFQVIEACRRLDIHVPEQIAVLGIDNDEMVCRLAKPALSSIMLPTRQIGFAAARLLDRLIEGRNPRRRDVRLPPDGIATRPSTDVLATDDREVAAAVRFVRENAHAPLSVADVLKVVPVGRRTLERRVRQFLGHSLGREIARVHLERARTLLATTDLPITQIAMLSGFTSGRHLAVTFKKCLGQSATSFRAASKKGA